MLAVLSYKDVKRNLIWGHEKNLRWKGGRWFYKGKNNHLCSPLRGPNVIKYWLLYDPPLSCSSVYKHGDNACTKLRPKNTSAKTPKIPKTQKIKMTGSGSPCGACKFLRRKCVRGCVFAPYFCHEQGATHFAAIHKVFGASNVSKLLAHLPVSDRCEAAVTISYEAQARLQDPIYGCVSHIFALQQQVWYPFELVILIDYWNPSPSL